MGYLPDMGYNNTLRLESLYNINNINPFMTRSWTTISDCVPRLDVQTVLGKFASVCPNNLVTMT